MKMLCGNLSTYARTPFICFIFVSMRRGSTCSCLQHRQQAEDGGRRQRRAGRRQHLGVAGGCGVAGRRVDAAPVPVWFFAALLFFLTHPRLSEQRRPCPIQTKHYLEKKLLPVKPRIHQRTRRPYSDFCEEEDDHVPVRPFLFGERRKEWETERVRWVRFQNLSC